LADFWMLHGFRPLAEIIQTMEAVPELRCLLPGSKSQANQAVTQSGQIRELYSRVMTLPQLQVDVIVRPLIERLRKEGVKEKDNPGYWALKATEEFPLPDGHLDRGIISIFLLNLVHLQPGQGTFQPAGVLHAYLEGVNVELMANSDNVLRGGLTPKYVDVEELLRILIFEGHTPAILNGKAISATEKIYSTPTQEFELSQIEVAPGRPHQSGNTHSADALLVLCGAVQVTTSRKSIQAARGNIFLAPYAVDYRLETASDTAVLYKASIPRSL
jgi:mannose-6-phosphate isomerase class I